MVMQAKEILETGLETQVRLRMTEDEFETWCDEDVKAEWVNGEVILMSPSNLKHVLVAGFLLNLMSLYARRRDLGVVVGPEFQIRFAKLRRRRVPDVLFISKDRLDALKPNHFEGAPDLAIEIASPDSVARDWREKYLEYEQAGVREYWGIDPMAQRMEAYALDEEGRYKLIEPKDGVIHSTALTGFWFKPDWLWQEALPDPLDLLKELGVL